MSSRLLVNPGTPQAWEIPLKLGINRIGRGDQNHFVVKHGSISTNHCEITVTDTSVILKDLGSTNGTFVNRSPVTEVQLHPGQHVQLGAVDMMFESTTVAPATVAAETRAATPPLPPPPPPPAAGLRIKSLTADSPAQTAPEMIAPAAHASQAVVTGFKPADSEPDDTPKKNFALSVTGVVLGAVIGMVAWHLIYRFTGWRLGFMALGIGCLAGVAPQLMGHYRGKLMGIIAALVTLTAIFTTQYLNARVQFDQFTDETLTGAYDERLKHAKEAVQAVPNGTDEEIRSFIAKEESDEDLKIKPEEIDTEQIKQFKEELPKLRDLASGKTTREEFNKEFNAAQQAIEETGFLKIYFIIRALGLFNIVNIVLGTGAAYMTAKGDRNNPLRK